MYVLSHQVKIHICHTLKITASSVTLGKEKHPTHISVLIVRYKRSQLVKSGEYGHYINFSVLLAKIIDSL